MDKYDSTKELAEIRTLLRIVEDTMSEGEFIRTMFTVCQKVRTLDSHLSLGTQAIPEQWDLAVEAMQHD